ncbi:hypothetical protein EUGRSUZ_C02775 [Eucalyptus grandis]|uniref:Uncharacterized protein n=2 Tax=Eucalyptus grandis TaxID=71139 RepID=A0ACC3LH42_EUCGR|nr:hypothetical protein EUGRSUZ_C02775 [Eucalyptus grandis]
MLLRSTSTPILKASSCNHQTPSEPELTFRLPTGRPFSLNVSSSSTLSDTEEKKKKISVTSSENGVRELLKPKRRLSSKGSSLILIQGPKDKEREEEEERYDADQVCDKTLPFQSVWSCSGGAGSGGDGGGGGDGGRDGCGDWGQGRESLDGYYQRMIKAHPGDALLLGNYARFLKEVQRDAEKAEEYCERAILAKRRDDEPTDGDGDVLSLYGDLIWTTHKDGPRAQSYFDQAVQSAPGDCYVLASYARFLWDAGEEEEDDDGGGGDHDHEAEHEQEQGVKHQSN